jgi:hypothetical protein
MMSLLPAAPSRTSPERDGNAVYLFALMDRADATTLSSIHSAISG